MSKNSFIGDLVIPVNGDAIIGEAGQLRFNSTANALQYHNGTSWVDCGTTSGAWFKRITQSGSATSTTATTADDTLLIASVGDLVIAQGAKSLIFENTMSEPNHCQSISTGYTYTSDYRKTDINDVDFSTIKNIHLRAGTHTLGVLGTETYSGMKITADAGAELILTDGITLENCDINVPKITQARVTGSQTVNAVSFEGDCFINAGEITGCLFLIVDSDSSIESGRTAVNVTIHCMIWRGNYINMTGGCVRLHAMHDRGTSGTSGMTNTFELHYGILEIHGLHCTNGFARMLIADTCQVSLVDCYFKNNDYIVTIAGAVDANILHFAFRNCLFATYASYCVYNPTANSNQYILNQGSISTKPNYGTYTYYGDAWNVQANAEEFY